MLKLRACCWSAAKWRGCTIAVKVLSHEGTQSARVNALHETVVSQHVSHPNVVGFRLGSVHACDAMLGED